MADWSDPDPGLIDGDAFLYMGSDPCWTPAREWRRPGDPDGAIGCCSLCGGSAPDGEIPKGSHRVCARCMRYGRERAGTKSPQVSLEGSGYVSRGGVSVPEKYSHLLG